MAREVSRLKIRNMSCQHCVSSIKSAVSSLEGVGSVEVDLKSKLVTVTYDPEVIKLQTIKETIEDQGYDVED